MLELARLHAPNVEDLRLLSLPDDPIPAADAIVSVGHVLNSAGSNIAGPTIKTTNDMPIVQPPSFTSLALVSFQINPHYIDADPRSTHMGETREQRLREYLEENEIPVLAIREPAILRIENEVVTLEGESGAKIFRRGREPQDVPSGSLVEI